VRKSRVNTLAIELACYSDTVVTEIQMSQQMLKLYPKLTMSWLWESHESLC